MGFPQVWARSSLRARKEEFHTLQLSSWTQIDPNHPASPESTPCLAVDPRTGTASDLNHYRPSRFFGVGSVVRVSSPRDHSTSLSAEPPSAVLKPRSWLIAVYRVPPLSVVPKPGRGLGCVEGIYP